MHKVTHKVMIPIFIILFVMVVGIAHGQTPATATTTSNDVPLVASEARVSAEILSTQIKSKSVSRHKRLQALQTLFNARKSLSEQEKIGFLNTTKTIAKDKQENAQLRANAIWALSGMGMMLKHEKTWTQEDVSRECQFMLQTAADESENLQVRRLSIAALGDLKMKEAVPILKALLTNKSDNVPRTRTPMSIDNVDPNSPILRSASIALAQLAPEDAIEPVGKVLAETTDPSVFGSAAYALGRTKSREAIPVLVENRLRLKDNLSVDNAIEATSETVIEILKQPTAPDIIPAIQATRSLWRDEQKEVYIPLLRDIVADEGLVVDVRRKALKRLMEDADMLRLDARKERIGALLPLVEGEDVFSNEIARMRLILNAQLLPITHIEGRDGEGVAK